MMGTKPDEMIRTPMQWSGEVNAGFTVGAPWEPLNSDFDITNVEWENSDPDSLLSFYKKMIRIRLKSPALEIGGYVKITAQDSSIYAVYRSFMNENVISIINLTNHEIKSPFFSIEDTNMSGSYSATDLISGIQYLPLMAEANGKVSNYLPIGTLPANARLVLYLSPQK